MARLIVFNQVSLDGYFVDANGDMSWAHKSDPEWDAFAAGNAAGGGRMVFGRVTYQMMASFWPTPAGRAANPVVAERMTEMPKIVFSRSLKSSGWANTTLVAGDAIAELKKLKASGPDLAILGSGNLVAQLLPVVDEFQLVVNPLVLGGGRTLFAENRLSLALASTRTFQNGNVLLCYRPR